ncbi:MAG: histidine phosphatase family protein [Bdellovibrionales bacterium]|nr:histidine phosphatase family protein [Bdellovibrionales bacterium]
MEILIVRHAIALEREEWLSTDQPDDLRPLTQDGKKKFERGAIGIRELAPEIEEIWTSPFLRAQETALLLQEVYPKSTELHKVPELAVGGSKDRLIRKLRMSSVKKVALVGHEPDLSELVSMLLLNRGVFLDIEIKKGSALCLELQWGKRLSEAKLLWMMTPKQLRMIGDSVS